MKKIIICLCLMFLVFAGTGTGIDAKAVKTVKLTIKTFDGNNEVLEGVKIEIESSIQIVTVYSNGIGTAKVKFKQAKHEIPKIKVSKEGYASFSGNLRLNAAGNLIIKLEESHD